MCGIVAMFAPAGGADPGQLGAQLDRALGALRHRGPDGSGRFISPDRSVALGHTRLAIVDPAGGAQPLRSESGDVVAVVSGELYDDARIRAVLQARGHRFATASDSEILIHLYEEHGLDCVDQLRGEFAFVLWDAREQRLVAGRDRFGVRPLVWSRERGVLRLASEAKALFAMGSVATWDREALGFVTTLQYLPPDRTLFARVRQLRPGHLLVAHGDTLEERRYWDLDYPAAGSDPGVGPASVEQIAELRDQLDQSVHLRLRADVPVAFQLSGGLDSSAVLGLAARHAAAPLDCFTVGFSQQGYDERALAAESAARVGARLEVVEVGPHEVAEHLRAALFHAEGPAINAHLVGKYLLARAISRRGFRVALTGEGADEVFSGYAHLRSDLFRGRARDGDKVAQQRLAQLASTNLASAGLMLPSGAALPLEQVATRLGHVPTWLAAKATLGHRLVSLLSDDARAELIGDRDHYREVLDGFDVAGQLEGRHVVDQSTYLWCKLALANYILRAVGDTMEMAHGVEGRLPFLDHHLFALARTLPPEVRLHDGVDKHALRLAVAPFVTPAVRARQKHPFLAPPLASSPELRAFVADTLGSADLPFFDRARVAALIDGLPALSLQERIACEPVLMTLLSLSLLGRVFALGGA